MSFNLLLSAKVCRAGCTSSPDQMLQQLQHSRLPPATQQNRKRCVPGMGKSQALATQLSRKASSAETKLRGFNRFPAVELIKKYTTARMKVQPSTRCSLSAAKPVKLDSDRHRNAFHCVFSNIYGCGSLPCWQEHMLFWKPNRVHDI